MRRSIDFYLHKQSEINDSMLKLLTVLSNEQKMLEKRIERIEQRLFMLENR